jgi:rRNA small subunit pseudouridine methyltransferase Nep1
LDKLKVRAVNASKTLMKVIKNPVTDYLPLNCLKIGTSCKARLVDVDEFIKKIEKNGEIVFVVGAVSKGNPGQENDIVQESVSISKYALSAS